MSSKTPQSTVEKLLTEIKLTQLSGKELEKEFGKNRISQNDFDFHLQLLTDNDKRAKYHEVLQSKLEEYEDTTPIVSKGKKMYVMSAVLLIAVMSLFVVNYEGITGFLTFDQQDVVTQTIDQLFVEDGIIQLNMTNATGLRISGTIIGEGNTEVVLQMNGQEYIVMVKDTTPADNLITGQVIGENDPNENETEEIIEDTIPKEEVVEVNNTMEESETPEEVEKVVEVNETIEVTEEENNTIEVNETEEIVEVNDTIEINDTEKVNTTIEVSEENNTLEINDTTEENVTIEVNETEQTEEVNDTEVEEEPTPVVLEFNFENECLETCALSISGGILAIDLSGTALQLDSITYTIANENKEPEQIKDIDNITLTTGYRIVGSEYFTDADGDVLTLDVRNIEGIITTIDDESVLFEPMIPGVYETFIYYTDGETLERSNTFTITIPGEQVVVPEVNDTEFETEIDVNITEENATPIIVEPEVFEPIISTEGMVTVTEANAESFIINLKDKNGNAIGHLKKSVSAEGLTLDFVGKTKKVKVQKDKNIPPGQAKKETDFEEVDATPSIIINNIEKAPAEIDIIIDETTQGIPNGEFTTPVIYSDSLVMESAIISLPRDGEVNSVMRCRNFVKETFACLQWERLNIPFTTNETHVTFEANRFSGYAGAELTIITLQSYPTKYGEWTVEFSTLGTADLTIEGWDGTEFGVDLEHVSLMCGDEVLTATTDSNSVSYSNFECNETATHTVRVLTDGKHTQKFTFGESVGYANNLASNVPKTISLQGKLTGAAGNINGSHNFTFKLYTVPTGGSAAWEENQTLSVNDGVYSAILGSVELLTIEFDGQYYLGVEVNEDGEMTPRVNLTSTPYTERARRADSVDCTDCINATHLQNDSILEADLSTTTGPTDNYILSYDDASKGFTWVEDSSGGSMSSFSLTGDSGTPETVADGNTVDIAGGTGITTAVGATDTVTVTATLGTEIVTGEITDDTILEADLDLNNTGTVGQILSYDGSSGFTWVDDDTGAGGTITSVTGASPIASTGGTTPEISATIAKDLVTTSPLTGSVDNVLLGTDSDLTIGITVAKDLVTTAPLTGSVDNVFTGADSDITIAMPVATTSASGYLSSTDWNTFNSKSSSTGDIEGITTTATTSGLDGGCTSGTCTLTIDASDLTDTTNDGIGTSGENFVVAGGTGLTATATGLNVDASQTQITGLGTITTGTWSATDIAVAAGGTGSSTDSGARTNLGATTIGSNMFTLTNPSAITFLRINADNTADALSASNFRTAIGAGTSSTTGDIEGITTTAGTSGLNGGCTSGTCTLTFDATDVDGTGLTGSGSTLNVDLGTSIVTGEIVDDTILEADLDLNNTGTVGQILSYDGSSGFTWVDDDTGAGGTITSVTGASPIASTGGTTPEISATIAKDLVTTSPLTGSVDNVLLGTDSDLTIGITVAKDLVTTAPLTGSVDNVFTGADSDITIAMPVATTSASGYLSSTDWNTFNSKSSSTGDIEGITTTATTSGLDGGCTSGTCTLTIDASDLTDTTNDGIGTSGENFVVAGGTGLTATATGLNVDASQTQITGLGTITTGTWSATDIAVAAGGTGSSTDSGARTNLGATTIGSNMFTLTNPSAITFLRINADNTADALSASNFRTAIGAGTSSTTGDIEGITTTAGTSGLNGGCTSGTCTLTFDATDVDGTGLTGSGSTLNVDLGTSIVTGEIVDDTILEADLDITNAPVNNYILSYDSGSLGFTWVVDDTGAGGDGSGGWINTSTNTSTSLDVDIDGDLYLSGTIYGGSDIAEIIPASEELEPGDVAVIDIYNVDTIKKSYSAYSTLVAGIVPTDPSITIGQKEDGTPIALVGRVPVKVTMENGPIAIGDLLVTSNTPGKAMRCDEVEKCFGAVLGKAMESTKIEGKITALVTLG